MTEANKEFMMTLAGDLAHVHQFLVNFIDVMRGNDKTDVAFHPLHAAE